MQKWKDFRNHGYVSGAVHHQKRACRSIGSDPVGNVCRVSRGVAFGQLFNRVATGHCQMAVDNRQMFACSGGVGQAVQNAVFLKPQVVYLVTSGFFRWRKDTY